MESKLEIPEAGKIYFHFKGHHYEVEKIEKGYVYYFNLASTGEYSAGSKHRRRLWEFIGYKIIDEDVAYNGIDYKKGVKVKRFTRI